MMTQPIRLNKYLAQQLGISRREADIWIEKGRILINDRPAHVGNSIQPDHDTIAVDQQILSKKTTPFTYLLLNKPIGYVCSRRQQDQSPTIYALLPPQFHHLKVAGRLDKDSSGLVLLTDDGDAIFKLTHPRFRKQKTYVVALDRLLTPTDAAHITSGVELEDGLSTLHLKPLPRTKPDNRYQVSMFEGRNRQIRRTFKALGYTVIYLNRTHLGPYTLDQLGDTVYHQI